MESLGAMCFHELVIVFELQWSSFVLGERGKAHENVK
jgi:hypothetical protein